MMTLALRVSSALAQRRVLLRLWSRRAALDEIGNRLARRAGDVDAVGAQVRDHARASLRVGQGGLGWAVPPLVRALGKLCHLEKLERVAQLGESDAARGLELAHIALGQRIEAS